jgi:hypothetical protein
MPLSRKGWNNVIIYAAMAMILVLNLANKQLFDDPQTTGDRGLLPQGAVILTLDVTGQYRIERLANSWRLLPDLAINPQQLDAMMMAWHDTVALQALTDESDKISQAHIAVSITLANSSLPYRLDFYPGVEFCLVYLHHSKQWLTLANVAYQQLFPINFSEGVH